MATSTTKKKTAARKAAASNDSEKLVAATAKATPKKKPVAAKKAPAKAATKAAPAKKVAAKKAPAKAAPAKAAAKTAPAKKAPAKAAPAKKAPAKAATKPTPAKPAQSPFSAKFLVEMKAALYDERATYTYQAKNLKEEADALVADFEAGDVQFDEESGEGDTLNVERERDLALSAQAQHQVGEIDHALTKFELGTYGICEVSGDPIPAERLEAIPWARERVEYKTGALGRR